MSLLYVLAILVDNFIHRCLRIKNESSCQMGSRVMFLGESGSGHAVAMDGAQSR